MKGQGLHLSFISICVSLSKISVWMQEHDHQTSEKDH